MTSEYWISEGKISRFEFCLFIVPNFILVLNYCLWAGYLFSNGLATANYANNVAEMWAGLGVMLLDPVLLVYTLHIIVPCINVFIRRYRDAGVTQAGTYVYLGYVLILPILYGLLWMSKGFTFIEFIRLHIPFFTSAISGNACRNEVVIALFSFLFLAALPLMLMPSKHKLKNTPQLISRNCASRS